MYNYLFIITNFMDKCIIFQLIMTLFLDYFMTA